MTRIFLSAGETSGDIHGANLIRALSAQCPDVVCEGLGGTRMAAAGMTLHHDLAEHAIMGFTEVVRSFGLIRRIFLDTVNRLESGRFDCLVAIDYPGFNMRLAAKAHGLGIPVVYYITPQVWAWKKGRVHTIARTCDKVLVILPFEEALFRDAGADCVYVGHPLMDHIGAAPLTGEFAGDLTVGLLPGSRSQEVERLLSPMLDVAARIREKYPRARFITPCVDKTREEQVRSIAKGFALETHVGKTYEVVSAARLCLVASGTATLETALLGVPMVVLYKVSPLSFWLAKRLVHLDNISLVNILAGKEVVPEFIQNDASAARIAPVALELMEDSPRRRRMTADLARVRAIVGEGGASERAASEVLRTATGRTA